MTDAGTGDDRERDPPDEADEPPEGGADGPRGTDADDAPDGRTNAAPEDGSDAGPKSDVDADRDDSATAASPNVDPGSSTGGRSDSAAEPSVTVGPSESPDDVGPTAKDGSADGGPSVREEPVAWFLTADSEGVAAVRDLLSTVALVALVGLFLFAVSGIWPPLVAVESGSMEPHMEKNDLVFIVDENRFAGEDAVAGVVTFEQGQENGVRSFGSYGDVIVFQPNGDNGVPIIHRAHIYVEEDEEWVARADEDHLRGDTCEEVRNCPAPHDGFITKGDDTPYYDQVAGRSTVVKSEWIKGRAEVRIPLLGWVRLQFAKL
ncbi:S26 family signal peptidase [Halostella salina]|uniref:S26 family signal peptidase n=1 Tax=Halostella salina TaxID=1547897 RepID=UPI00196A1425|nr:S26 family signal peptidase [Halostella salina]